MLRRRAEHNRCDPLNIDSDDDEWKASDDEFAISEEDAISKEDEDSVVDSLVCQGITAWGEINDDDSHEYATGIAKAPSHHYDVDVVCGLEGITNVSKNCPGKLLNNCGADPLFRPSVTLLVERGDHDLNNQLCVSSGTVAEPQASQLKIDNSKSFTATFNGVSDEGGHEFFLEPCDAEVWDVGSLTFPRNDFVFLPTFGMIEEVF